MNGRVRRRRMRRCGLPGLAVALAGFGLPFAPGADSTAPTVVITVPALDATLDGPPFVIGGTAADDVGVSSVGLRVKDNDTGLYLRSDGTWGASQVFAAVVVDVGGTDVTWSASFDTIPPCDCSVTAQARDTTGNKSLVPSVRFASGSPGSTEPAYLTLLMGRSIWAISDGCTQPLPISVPLDQVSAELSSRGLTATGTVVTGRVLESSRNCLSRFLYASWDDLADLRDSFGWSFVSSGKTQAMLELLDPSQQIDETCGSLQILSDHGHQRAWGMYAWPAGRTNASIQQDVIASCFAYGRMLRPARNLRAKMAAPWFAKSTFISGGRCNDLSLPCGQTTFNRSRYWPVDSLINLVGVNPDEWVALQFYMFVSGARLSGQLTWDCTSPDWRAHWTSAGETYCWNDFLTALDAIPASVTIADPGTVAEAWGEVAADPVTPANASRSSTEARERWIN